MNTKNATKSKKRDRRRFLKEGVALAGLTAAGIHSAKAQAPASQAAEERPRDTRAYGDRSRFEKSARGQQVLTPLSDSVGIITASPLHFSVGTYPAPEIDPEQHRLTIEGMVEHPLTFTREELKRKPSVSRIHFVECAGNSKVRPQTPNAGAQERHGRTGCCEWTGVSLALLLREAGVKPGASWVIAEGADAKKHTRAVSLEKVMEDVLIAYGQNGEAVRPEQGYPLRLLIPGWEGHRNVKWVRRIEVVDQAFVDKMPPTADSIPLKTDGKPPWFQYEMALKAVITSPAVGQPLPGRGFYEISGLAWSAGGAIRKVEVSTDGGRTWKEAQLQQPVLRIAHTRFRFPWTWNGEEVVIQARSTDERGQVQPTLTELIGGWYGLKPEDVKWETSNRVSHFNAIQPVKVTREGNVENALS